jgi:hypothetical protein
MLLTARSIEVEEELGDFDSWALGELLVWLDIGGVTNEASSLATGDILCPTAGVRGTGLDTTLCL